MTDPDLAVGRPAAGAARASAAPKRVAKAAIVARWIGASLLVAAVLAAAGEVWSSQSLQMAILSINIQYNLLMASAAHNFPFLTGGILFFASMLSGMVFVGFWNALAVLGYYMMGQQVYHWWSGREHGFQPEGQDEPRVKAPARRRRWWHWLLAGLLFSSAWQQEGFWMACVITMLIRMSFIAPDLWRRSGQPRNSRKLPAARVIAARPRGRTT